MSMLNRVLRNWIPARSASSRIPSGANLSYSGEREDRVIYRLLEADSRPTGFFVDVGAHHPRRYSNTYAFYQKGWRGINIDARPGSMAAFAQMRPRDVNLELAISDREETLSYFEFNEPAVNTFSPEHAEEHLRAKHYTLVAETTIKTVSLASVLDKHLPAGQQIDFMTIDVEGLDERVLRSNNWAKYRPDLVLAEDLGFPGLERAADSSVVRFLREQGYELFSKTYNTLFFLRRT